MKECKLKRATICSYYKDGICLLEYECKEIPKACEKCNKVVEFDGTKYCSVYVNPEGKWKNGICPMASHVSRERKDEEKFIDPLKKAKQLSKMKKKK